MSAYDYLLTDGDVTYYADRLPNYDALIDEMRHKMAVKLVLKEEAKAIVLGVLQDALRAYAQTPAKTKGGEVGRFFAYILSFINPFKKR